MADSSRTVREFLADPKGNPFCYIEKEALDREAKTVQGDAQTKPTLTLLTDWSLHHNAGNPYVCFQAGDQIFITII